MIAQARITKHEASANFSISRREDGSYNEKARQMAGFSCSTEP